MEFIGTCFIPGTACIVTEYFDMRSVKTYIDEGTNEWEQIRRVVRVALKVAKAMKFIHDKGVIHFNLKINSIVVSESPSGYKSFKLTNLDFVIVESEATPTGTPKHENYECMAPEVLRGDHFDRRADVYSFGIMLSELLMKGKPYGSMTPMQVAGEGILGQIPNLPKKWKKMYPRLPALIETCCKFNRTQRPSFHEIEEQLKEMEEEVLIHHKACFKCIS